MSDDIQINETEVDAGKVDSETTESPVAPTSTEPVISYITIRGKTYRVVNGVRHREIDGYIRSEVVAELADVRAAIKSVVGGGQSYHVGSRSLTRISPNQLYDRERYLLSLLSQFDNDSGDMRVQRFIPRHD